MIALMFYFGFTILTGGKISFSILCLATFVDMANCTAIVWVNFMFQSQLGSKKINVIKELNKNPNRPKQKE